MTVIQSIDDFTKMEMKRIKLIDYSEIMPLVDVYYFGWSEHEIAEHVKQYQALYYGDIEDARFSITDKNENTYYAIFRNVADYEVARKAKDYLLFKDDNRVLFNIGGGLYRYSIEERKILDNKECYAQILCNDSDITRANYFHSISCPDLEVMIVMDDEGFAAINWDGVLWKHKFDWAYAGYLELTEIKAGMVFASAYEPINAEYYTLAFDIQTGKYTEELQKR